MAFVVGQIASRLSPSSPLTIGELQGLEDLFVDYRNKLVLLRNAFDNLRDAYVTMHQSLPNYLAVDVFGDGRIKLRRKCVRPAGWIPERMRHMDIQGEVDSNLVGPSATEITQMRSRYSLLKTKMVDRNTAGQLLNSRINKLAFKVPVPIGSMLDVFGDGLVKPVNMCEIPSILSIIKTRIT